MVILSFLLFFFLADVSKNKNSMISGGKSDIHNIEDFSLNLFSLKGKNAIVTGGNSGLGQGFATALAKAGANILAVSIMDDG